MRVKILFFTLILLFIKLYVIILVKKLKEIDIKGRYKKYYENTENALLHPMVKKFIDMNMKPKNAIDVGCGAGRDTIYLIKNGREVLSINREDTKEIISSRLNKEEIKKFRFNCQNFENIKDYFNEFWNKINDSILKERILCWKLF